MVAKDNNVEESKKMKKIAEFKYIQCTRDLKLYYMCEYINGKLELRKQIPFFKNDYCHFQLEEKSGEYIIRRSKKGAILGKCEDNGDGTANITKVYISNKFEEDDGFSSNPYNLIENINELTEEYVNKYFKLYYDLIEFCNEQYNSNYSKVTALKFYYLVREMFESNEIFKDKYVFSEPNCFILNEKNGIEYDALILRKGKEDNIIRGFYSEKEIIATVELKGGGFIAAKKNLNKKIAKYLKREAVSNIPHIYISLFESSVKKNGHAFSNYEKIIKGIHSLNDEGVPVKPLILSTKNDNQRFMVSKDCSVEGIIKFIEQNEKI